MNANAGNILAAYPGRVQVSDPRGVYPVMSADALEIKETQGDEKARTAKEYKVGALASVRCRTKMHFCDTPQKAADYWRLVIATNPYFNVECECFLILDTPRRVKQNALGTAMTCVVTVWDQPNSSEAIYH